MTTEEKISAMQKRKKEFDGKFYVAVRTTHICMSAELSRTAAFEKHCIL